MRAVLVSVLLCAGCSGRGDNVCRSACDRLEQCVSQIPGATAGKCTIDTINCAGIYLCVSNCVVAASCEQILVQPGVSSSYAACLAQCGGVPPDGGPPDGPPPDSSVDAPPAIDLPLTGDGPPTKDGAIHLDGAPVKPSSGCMDESNEPNNTTATATALIVTGLIPGWQICYPGDVDHFAIQLTAGQQLVAKVLFSHSKGDLDAALLDPAGMVVATSRSEDDDEQISYTAAASGAHVLGVIGFGEAVNTYDLSLQIQ